MPSPEAPVVVDAQFLAAAARADQLPPPTVAEIAFAGRSNVGKSSLMNALVGRKGLVRTSSTPGCTRGVNLFEVRLRGDAVLRLADLPGYGWARRSKQERAEWAELVEAYLLERPSLTTVVVLVDARRGAEQDDLDVLELARDARVARGEVKTLLVATKTDKLPKAERKLAVERIAEATGRRVIGVSIKDPSSVEKLRRTLLRVAEVQGATAASGS